MVVLVPPLLRVLGTPMSTYYRWRRQAHGAREHRWQRPWNRLTVEEDAMVPALPVLEGLAVAWEMPEWRGRQLAA